MRQPKPPRLKSLLIRLSDQEEALLTAAAKGYPLATWARLLLLTMAADGAAKVEGSAPEPK